MDNTTAVIGGMVTRHSEAIERIYPYGVTLSIILPSLMSMMFAYTAYKRVMRLAIRPAHHARKTLASLCTTPF